MKNNEMESFCTRWIQLSGKLSEFLQELHISLVFHYIQHLHRLEEHEIYSVIDLHTRKQHWKWNDGHIKWAFG